MNDYRKLIKESADHASASYFLDHLSKMASEDKGMSALAFDCLKEVIEIMTPEQRKTIHAKWEKYFENEDEFKDLMDGKTSKRLNGIYSELQKALKKKH